MKAKKRVVIGLLGSVLDRGEDDTRWNHWRPTLSLFQHDDFLVHKLHLVSDDKTKALSATVAADIAAISPETEVAVHHIPFSNAWDFEEVFGSLLDFAKSLRFNPEAEEYLVHITTGSHVQQICLYLLTESKFFPAQLLQSSPPPSRDKGKPGRYAIIDLDLSKYDKIATRFQAEQKTARDFLKTGIHTRNPAFNALIERIEQVAAHSREPILLMGPTGAGKSRLAKRIFELKKSRSQVGGAFVGLNCATLKGDGAMSALFGHVKGAFTGAQADRPGLLRQANKGILFLDEIGELGLDEQTMLLHALEEKRFFPLGSDKEAQSDFQLIAGTNRDLGEAVEAGVFREDLLARINLWTFKLPGLAGRPEDIEPNLQYELDQFGLREARKVTFSREGLAAFLAFATSKRAKWPANFRDLNAAIIRMATLAPAGRIGTDTVDEEIDRLQAAWGAGSRVASPLESLLGRKSADGLDLFDRCQLETVVRACREADSLSDAGRALFAESRKSKANPNDADRLRKYLTRFGLDWKRIKSAA